MTRWSLFLQTLSLLHHFLGLYLNRWKQMAEVTDLPSLADRRTVQPDSTLRGRLCHLRRNVTETLYKNHPFLTGSSHTPGRTGGRLTRRRDALTWHSDRRLLGLGTANPPTASAVGRVALKSAAGGRLRPSTKLDKIKNLGPKRSREASGRQPPIPSSSSAQLYPTPSVSTRQPQLS